MPSDTSSPGEPVKCSEQSLALAEAVDSAGVLGPAAASHVNTCLRCQAELAQYRKLRRAMGSMTADLMVYDSLQVEDLLETLRPLATVHKIHGSTSRRKAYIGGIAAAATAGAAGAIVFASRLSRQRVAS